MDKQDFIWAVKQTLFEQLEEKSPLLEASEYEYKKYIIENLSEDKTVKIGKIMLFEHKIFTRNIPESAMKFAKKRYSRVMKNYKGDTNKVAKIMHKASNLYSSAQRRDLAKAHKIQELKANLKSTQQAIRQAQPGQYKENVVKGTINYFKQSPKQIVGDMKKFYSSSQGQQALKYGGLALLGTAGLAVAANYIYKRFFSAAAKACAGKSGAEKTLCMKNYQRQAIQKTIQKLQSDMKACSKATNPQKCQASIQKQIMKWKAKLARV